MNNKTRSLLHDGLQITTLAVLLFTGPVFTGNVILSILQIISGMVIVSATWEMRSTKFYRIPDVGRQAKLVTGGIYKFIRHPMYTAQILFSGTLIAYDFTPFRFFVYSVLIVNFILKIKYEERLLSSNFSEYAAYTKRTFRLIPFIY